MPEFKHIVRIAGTDVSGSKEVIAALSDVKGIGWNVAHAIVNLLDIDPRMRLGYLTDEQIGSIERAIKDIKRLKVPSWMLNRPRDLETGEDLHLIGADLEFAVKRDIDREKAVQSWRGVRHMLGLKVRGQRTRTTGRKGQTVGVRKRAK